MYYLVHERPPNTNLTIRSIVEAKDKYEAQEGHNLGEVILIEEAPPEFVKVYEDFLKIARKKVMRVLNMSLK
jgi:hypothetical protein